MNGTFGLEWGGLNSQRSYPFTDLCTRVSDSGTTLPDSVITDAHFTRQRDLDERVFIGSVRITDSLVSVTIAASDGSNFVPLGVVTAASPVVVGKPYAVRAIDESFAGWITFGPGISENGDWTFSAATQTEVLPSLVLSFSESGVLGFTKPSIATEVRGDVTFISDTPDELLIESIPPDSTDPVTINGTAVEAITFGLNIAVNGRALLERFIGPCDTSPESGTCRKPAIFDINGAVPDCDGQIEIEFIEVASLLSPLVTVEAVPGDESQTEIGTTIDQTIACNIVAPRFRDSCPDNCTPEITGGPYGSYNPQYGSYNPLDCSA